MSARSRWLGSDRPARERLLRLLGPALILLLAAWLRLPALDHLPPGLHFDEAVYGLMAEDIRAGARPVFFSAYTGREPLYMYLLALVFAITGPTAWALRLTSALVGVVTVALIFALGRALYGRRVGLLAAGLSAVVMWPLIVQRNGYPNVLIPPIEAAAALALWRGWRRGRARDFALGGALTGLVLYTYLAARFWPVFLALFVAFSGLVAPRHWWRRAGGIALAVACAALVFAPLGWYFLDHPADFVERASQVLASADGSGGASLPGLLAANLRRSIQGMVVPMLGDPRWHFNLPGRPVFGLVAGLALAVGALRCLRHARDPRFALPLLWALVLMMPGILTDEMQPAGQRIFGAWPALALLAALGGQSMGRFARAAATRVLGQRAARGLGPPRGSRSSRAGRLLPWAAAAIGLALVGHELWRTARDYPAWAKLPETVAVFDSATVTMAQIAASEADPSRLVLLTRHWHHATVAFLAPEVVDRARWADPRLALPFAAEAGGGTGGAPRRDADAAGEENDTAAPGNAPLIVLLPAPLAAEASRAAATLAGAASEARCLAPGRASQGRARVVVPVDPGLCEAGGRSDAVWRYVLPPDTALSRPPNVVALDAGSPSADSPPAPRPASAVAPLASSHALEVEIAGEVAVGHMGLVDHPRRDEALVLAVDWRVLATPARDRSFTLHLVDSQGHVWSQADDAGYIAAEWRKGDRVRQWFELALDRAMPPGSYQARLMLLDAEGTRLPVRLPEGVGDAMPVAEVRIGPDGRARAEAGRAVHSLFGATSEVAEATGGAEVDGASELGITADGPGALALLDVAVDARIAPSGTLSLELLWARSGGEPAPDGLSDWILEARRLTSAAEELTRTAPQERAAVQPRILDRQPIAPGYPPSLWARRELLRGRYALQAPGDLDAGDHDLVLRVGDGPGALIGRVTVDAVARRFEAPAAMDVTLDALGSDHLRLLGLDLEPRPPVAGEPFTVTLWWRAESTTDTRYKVFVHLDRPDGHLLAQDDSEPAQATRPTSGWLPGEVVADPHRIAPPIGLPAGDYVLGVGLYDPVSGARLSLTDAKGKAVPEDKLRLPVELR